MIMADLAREQLDLDIERARTTGEMLKHLADAIEHGPKQRGGESYQGDAIEALMHGAELARDRKINLLHVAHVYDAKVTASWSDK
jgi:hypothetical protein